MRKQSPPACALIVAELDGREERDRRSFAQDSAAKVPCLCFLITRNTAH